MTKTKRTLKYKCYGLIRTDGTFVLRTDTDGGNAMAPYLFFNRNDAVYWKNTKHPDCVVVTVTATLDYAVSMEAP